MPKFGLKTLLVCFVGVAVLLAFVYPAVQQVREAARCTECKNKMRQLALGILNYESGYGHLPVGIEESIAGTPRCSWRVLVAPYLESAQQFYDPNFSWNSPTNAQLYDGSSVIATDKGGGNPRSVVLDRCPHWFWCCPSASEKSVNYAVVVGEETAFPLNRSVKLEEITDGIENTILLVETLSGSTIWTEPHDVRFDTMKFSIGRAENGELASNHQSRINVAFADAQVYSVDQSISPSELRALFTIAGGEKTTRQDLIDRGILY